MPQPQGFSMFVAIAVALPIALASVLLGRWVVSGEEESQARAGQDPPAPQAPAAAWQHPGADPRLRPVRTAAGPLPAMNQPRIVVYKAQRVLRVYDGASLVRTYPVCVGRAEGDKHREGDRRTPEGRFYVCVKNPRSQYTLSLGLSYPNIEDAERGLAAGLISRSQYEHIRSEIRRRRQPPWNPPLGGAIMIHGGGAERTGTAGCVGMHDEHIRQLYAAIDVGTEVVVRP